jgi:hypothetical protein
MAPRKLFIQGLIVVARILQTPCWPKRLKACPKYQQRAGGNPHVDQDGHAVGILREDVPRQIGIPSTTLPSVSNQIFCCVCKANPAQQTGK